MRSERLEVTKALIVWFCYLAIFLDGTRHFYQALAITCALHVNLIPMHTRLALARHLLTTRVSLALASQVHT